MPARTTAARKASRQRATARAAEAKIAARKATARAAYVREYESHDFIQDRDDRPRTEYQSRSWVTVQDITYTERQSTTLTGWAGVVAKSACMDNSGSGHNARTPIR
jgi:hypothetical protein